MLHSFDVENAKAYGVVEAVIIENLSFWIEKNRANGRHFYDGRVWTYNSAKAFAELFPYLSVGQIRRALDSLEMNGVIVRGNFNQSAYDRTSWYSFSDKWISRKDEIHLSNLPNGNGENNEPIPDIKQDSKPASKPKKEARCADIEKPDSVDEQTWQDYKKLRAARKAPLTKTALAKIAKQAELAGYTLEQALQTCCEKGWQGFDASWLANTSGLKNPVKKDDFAKTDYGNGIRLI